MSARTIIAVTTIAGHTIPVASVNGKFVVACAKCQGTGHIAHFGYHDDGVCYGCAGQGIKSGTKAYATELELVTALDKAAKTRDARRAREHAKWEAEREANIAAYEAQQEAERLAAEAAAAEREAASSHLVGEIGERVGFTGTVKVLKSFSGNYGPSLFVVVALTTGGEVKFFSTANFAWDLNEGDEVSLTGEIAGFDAYQGTKQTTVKKAKIAK